MGMFKVSPEVKPRSQPFSTCCWLTCLKMMFEWKHDKNDKTKNPEKILEIMDAAPSLWPYEMEKSGIAPGECKDTARILGLRWSGDGEIEANVLADMMPVSGPLWVAGMWRKGSSHVIVVTGVDKESGKVTYIDPWENYSLTESSGPVSWLNSRGPVWKNCDASIMYWS